MCTVLQQHLARQMNGYDTPETANNTAEDSSELQRQPSPLRLTPQPTYSYLGAAQDGGFSMKKPIDPYDRKKSAPAMHFHVPPPNADGTRPSSRSRSLYSQQLWGRSRSHSRTGMRAMVDELKSSTPRPKSPHMNNEEPISFSHYPDGHPPNDEDEVDEAREVDDAHKKKRKKRKKRPIERDDFPAPPFPYVRRRHWSEPMKSSSSDEDEECPVETVQSSSSEEEEVPDPKLDQTESELKKISTGMASVFLADLAEERIRRKVAKSTKFIDPRSAARTPAANREPAFRLRYDSPVNASPSRIADHLRPWDDDYDGHASRRSFFSATPFLPSTPGLVGGRISTTSPKGRKSSTLPSRASPAHPGLAYSTDFSTDISDGEKDSMKPVRVSSAYAPTPPSSNHHQNGGGSLPNMPPSSLAATDDEDEEMEYIPQAPNVYPLHLLLTTNYRLPGDVDRCNLERHLTDSEFEAVFKCLRDEFYRMPYWKRCDLKRRNFLF